MTMPALIIEAAVNGGTPKSRNRNVPRSPAEIAEDGIACIEAGASIVHNHNDDAFYGSPNGRHAVEPYIEAWTAILAAHADVLLYPTMASGGPQTIIEERYAHIPALAEAGLTRLGLIDPGSVNIGGMDASGLPIAADSTYINTLRDTRYMFDTCVRMSLSPSVSIFEPGFLRVALAYHKAGHLPPGALIKLYFGGPNSLFGLPPTATSLDAYLAMLEGSGLQWSVAVLGGDVIACGLARVAIERGGHVRVGLEDYAGSKEHPRNVELVQELVELANECGRPIATPTEAAGILGIPQRF